ncbi:hypothetical protein GCT13_40940 [Paraburkholderia sp. CNPSo 3157]|uniref:Uncharacterized protein n=1 Tax=Paraburkholderia franconis TaxID=2654983 RepID=A0A7X1NJH5_9BURK|nr:hypothetical protein [Paraburkholderia franconis]MPW22987.1 hypothetical protein [Paraburkholderia franconis]
MKGFPGPEAAAEAANRHQSAMMECRAFINASSSRRSPFHSITYGWSDLMKANYPHVSYGERTVLATWLPPDVLSQVRSGLIPPRQEVSHVISELFDPDARQTLSFTAGPAAHPGQTHLLVATRLRKCARDRESCAAVRHR